MSATPASKIDAKAAASKESYSKYLPYAAFAGAGAFLGISGLLGMKMGVRAFQKAEAAEGKSAAAAVEGPLETAHLLKRPVPSTQFSAGQFARRALLYGTLLCAAGSTVTVLVLAYALDFRDLNGFADRMRELMPKLRAKLENTVVPVLKPIAGGISSTVAPAVHGGLTKLGNATKSTIHGDNGQGGAGGAGGADLDDTSKLSKRDKKALEELERFFMGEDSTDTDEGAGKAKGGSDKQSKAGSTGSLR
jgi:hypothetical protein